VEAVLHKPEEIGFTVGAERQVQPEKLYRLLFRLVERVDAACERTMGSRSNHSRSGAQEPYLPRFVVGNTTGGSLPNRNQGSY
jgi:hypothetical protein